MSAKKPAFKKLRLVILISGSGTNLAAIINKIEQKELSAEIVIVISNDPKAFGLERARKANIKTRVFSLQDFYRKFKAKTKEEQRFARKKYNTELANMIKRYKPDLVVMAGWLIMLLPEFVRQFPQMIINLHPALLPKYGGPGMYGDRVHRAVLKSGDKYSGATVHFVDQGIDTGPIILQKKLRIKPGDTVKSLSERIHKVEHQILPEAIQLIANGK